MTLLIPPPVLMQAVLAGVAGAMAIFLGITMVRRGWRYRDHRAERDFESGLCIIAVGVSWVILAGAIVLGSLVGDDEAMGQQIQEMVVFTNAAARIVVLLLGAHVLYTMWRRQ